MTTVLACAMLLLGGRDALAQHYGPGGAFALPGTQQFVARLRGETIQLYGSHAKPVYETKTVQERTPEGQVVEKQVVVMKMVMEIMFRDLPLDEARVYGTDKRRIDAGKLPELLQEDTVVLVSPPDQKIDATYLKLVQPGTLIVALPSSPPAHEMPTPPVAVPAPQEPAGPAAAADIPQLPTANPPLAALARAGQEGQVQLKRLLISTSEETSYRLVRVGDVEKQVLFSIRHTTRTESTKVVPRDVIEAYDLDGQRVDDAALAAALAQETPVLVSADGRPVDPFYLKIIRPGTLVLVVPQPPPAVAPIPAVAPRPAGQPAPAPAAP